MKILNLRLLNLNSLQGESFIDFEQAPLAAAGLFAITGPTGAGKTTILDAITLALYGKMHRNKDGEQSMSHGTSESMAEVVFEAKGSRYLAKWMIRRAFGKADGKLQPTVREVSIWDKEKDDYRILAEKITESDSMIEEITGLDFGRFNRSVLLAQGNFASFLDATGADRSALLEQITGTEQYTLISRKAFERSRAEKHKLDLLQQSQGEIKTLDAEESKQTKASLKNLKTILKPLEEEGKARADELQWLQNLDTRKEKIATEEIALKALLEERQARSEDLSRLDRHNHTRPFRQELASYDAKLTAKAGLEKDLDKQQDSLKDLREKAETEVAKYTELASILAEREEHRKKTEEIIFQVTELDTDLKSRKEVLDDLGHDIEDVRTKKKDAEERISHLLGQLETKDKERIEVEAGLKELEAYTGIGEALGQLEAHHKRWEEEKGQEKELESKILEERSKHTTEIAKIEDLQRKVEEAGKACEDLKAQFAENIPAGYTSDRRSLLKVLEQEVLTMGAQGNTILNLGNAINEYYTILHQEVEAIDRLDGFEVLEGRLQKEFLNQADQMFQLQEEVDERRKMFEQQQTISNYEKDRELLKPGEECPLCLSREHPFRQHPVKTFVDKTRKDYQQAQAKLEAQKLALQKSLAGLNRLTAHISGIRGEDHETPSGRLAELKEKQLAYEKVMRDLMLELASLDPNVNTQEAFASWRAAWERKKDFLHAQRKSLLEINNKLEEQESAFAEAREKLLVGKSGLKLIAQELNKYLDQKERHSRNATKAFEGLAKLISPLGIDLDREDPTQTINTLKRRKSDREDLQTRHQDLKDEISILTQSLNSDRKSLKEFETELGKKEKKQAALSKARKEISEKRIGLFGDRDTGKARITLREAVDAAKKSHADQQAIVAKGQNEISRIEGQVRQLDTDLKKTEEQASSLAKTLKPKVKKAGFESLEIAREALLSPEDENSFESLKGRLDKLEAGHAKSLKEAREEYDTLVKLDKTKATREELESNINKLKADLNLHNQEIGKLQEILNADKKQRERHKELHQQIEQQTKEYFRWSKLSDLIGSADGKKFRVFAQGLTLKSLVILANIHLHNLNDRYRIRHRGGDGLELDIVDTYQADNMRSMKTLSGGERFLVSLALALGLSDLAGQRNNIRSLFIDEGFGTLDKETLDVALATLENLQASGKTIGIISHVEELKERVAVQIQVRRQGNGLSTLDIVGA